MASELNVLARDAGRIARSNRRTCDFTDNILHLALREIVARFPVYRTYIDGTTPSEADRRDIDWAIAQARRTEHAPDASVFDFLHDCSPPIWWRSRRAVTAGRLSFASP